MTTEQLRQRAESKLSLASHRAPFNTEQIRRLVSKPDLNEQDIAQLEHFVSKTTRELSKTVYYGNTIVDPSMWEHVIYKRNQSGKFIPTKLATPAKKKKSDK